MSVMRQSHSRQAVSSPVLAKYRVFKSTINEREKVLKLKTIGHRRESNPGRRTVGSQGKKSWNWNITRDRATSPRQVQPLGHHHSTKQCIFLGFSTASDKTNGWNGSNKLLKLDQMTAMGYLIIFYGRCHSTIFRLRDSQGTKSFFIDEL